MKSIQKVLLPSLFKNNQRLWVPSSRLYTSLNNNNNNNTSTNHSTATSLGNNEVHHDEFHALYNNENQSVLDHLDHPSYHEKQSGNPDAFAPNFNSVFDE
ncbi:unnamed protein product [Cunninghamella blakesleeana]